MLAIETINLSKEFHASSLRRLLARRDAASVQAVQDISLGIESGQIFGLLGPNGAGKTTLIKILCTLIVPTHGTARVNGYDLARDPARLRASIGLVTADERSFYARLSGRENLRFFAALHNLPSRVARQRVDELLEQVELTDAADRHFQTYSTGMRQRLSIARGLIHNPTVLFLDEPTRGLDPTATAKLHALITDEIVGRQRKTAWLTTQRLDEAEKLCHHIAIMDRGKLLANGTLGELKALFAQSIQYTLLVQNSNGADERIEFAADPGGEELGQRINRIIAGGGKVRDVLRAEASLETVFARIVAQARSNDA